MTDTSIARDALILFQYFTCRWSLARALCRNARGYGTGYTEGNGLIVAMALHNGGYCEIQGIVAVARQKGVVLSTCAVRYEMHGIVTVKATLNDVAWPWLWPYQLI